MKMISVLKSKVRATLRADILKKHPVKVIDKRLPGKFQNYPYDSPPLA